MYDFKGDFATYYTGEKDIRTSGLYDTFHGSPNLPQWKHEHCSKIQGASDGTKFTSYMNENETLLFFRKSMCRPQRLVSILLKFSQYFVNNLFTTIDRNMMHTNNFNLNIKFFSSFPFSMNFFCRMVNL